MFGTEILGKILGSKGVIKNAMSGIDKAIFTREEKADYMLKFLAAYEPFKLAQRILAIMFSSVFLFGVLSGMIMVIIGSITAHTDIVISGKELISTTWQSIGTPESLIIAFYFAGGTINTFMKRDVKAKQKKDD